MDLTFTNSYARLPDHFFSRTWPTHVRAPRLVSFNRELAGELGLDTDALDALDDAALAGIFAGNRMPDGAEPIATAYAGHQFGSFVPQLGDGRAIMLGEVVDRSGVRREIQLKGSGPTPFSRGGDGRAAIGPVLREYIVSEAMHALGIATTRALAAVTTGENVRRERALPGAILTRVASSHIRVGTFEYFARRGDVDATRTLADHVIARHYPHAADAVDDADGPVQYRALLDAVIAVQAELVADWLLVGFIHGVMNTDNMSIAGETIDYGPCAFMDEYNAATVFSAIDRGGRYAYANQPAIAQWNLARFAECLLPLLSDDADTAITIATTSLDTFAAHFERAYHGGLRRKLGLHSEREDDLELAADLLQLMTDNGADFTLTFRRLADAAGDPVHDDVVRAMFIDTAGIDAWLARWRLRIAHEDDAADHNERADAMRSVNPAYIPRNHRIEAVIRAAEDRADFAPFAELLAVLACPFDERPGFAQYMQPPQDHERVLQTFCGT